MVKYMHLLRWDGLVVMLQKKERILLLDEKTKWRDTCDLASRSARLNRGRSRGEVRLVPSGEGCSRVRGTCGVPDAPPPACADVWNLLR